MKVLMLLSYPGLTGPAELALSDGEGLRKLNNGLIHVLNRFRNEKIAGHVTLTKGERSALAECASNVL